MTPHSARRKAAGMVRIVRDYLGWAVKYPRDPRQPDGPHDFEFAFRREEARTVRAQIVDEYTQRLLQEQP